MREFTKISTHNEIISRHGKKECHLAVNNTARNATGGNEPSLNAPSTTKPMAVERQTAVQKTCDEYRISPP
jgi:hypothetical protein